MTKSVRAALLAAVVAVLPGARAQEPTRMPTIEVIDRAERRGTAEEAYRIESLNSLGPLGTAKILDLPYTVSVLPRELIENSQGKNFKEVSKYLPLVSFQEQQGPQILRPQTRGMQGGNFQNSRLDGMTMYVTVANAMEQFQQIEVVNGVSSSIYGPANPSGMFNFVSKRPTAQTFARVNLSYDTSAIGTAHVDFGGPVDSGGVLAYRVNALYGDGTGYVDHGKLTRGLGAVALDVKPMRDVVVELNLSDYDLVQKGYPGWFTYGQGIVLPRAPDPTRVGYGQEYAGVDMHTREASVRVRADFGPQWRAIFGILDQDASRDINTPVNNLRNNNGTYISSLGNGFAPRFRIDSDMGYLNGTFRALGMDHDFTLGTAGYRSLTYSVRTPPSAVSVLLGTATIDEPLIFPPPAVGLPPISDNFNSSIVYQQGINVADTAQFNEAWSARLAVSQDWIKVANYNAAGAVLPGYKSDGASPSASLMFKPLPEVNIYATYANSLQAGDIAPGTAANAGSSLAPYRSKSIELGIKSSFRKLDLAAALFRIERPFAGIDPADSVFKITGNQVNKGLELSALGALTEDLTVYSGVIFLDAKLDGTGNPATDGKLFVGQPKYKGNILFEYRVPGVAGLVTSFDWQFSASRPGNDTNTFDVPAYNIIDLGARYAMKAWDRNLTWRLTLNNVTDVHYWSTVAPSNLTGANTGNLVAHLGAPRTVTASLSIDF